MGHIFLFRARVLATLGTCICLLPSLAVARTHALLVGVSEYPSLARRYQLAGPANDVRLYQRLLLDRGVSAGDIHLLADGVKGAALPSRAAILQAFQSLANNVKQGDLVFVLLSGHGSRQPAPAGSAEPDALDEIFLPRDVGGWYGQIGSVRNAITDDELHTALHRLRLRGAFVWAVFDTCNAGTIARTAVNAEQRDRGVPPEVLGIELDTVAAAKSRATMRNRLRGAVSQQAPIDSGEDGNLGDYVYMYAGQSYQATPELRLPPYSIGARRQGLFSYTLHLVLRSPGAFSYRQAMERVLQIYLLQRRETPSPLYEGSGLDTPVFATTGSSPLLQWRVDRNGGELQLRMGQLDGITQGSILALSSAPIAAATEVLGYARVESVALGSAVLVPIAHAGRAALKRKDLPAGAYARPVELKIDFRLRVAPPRPSADCERPTTAITKVIDELRSTNEPRLLWTDSSIADVSLCQRAGRLLLRELAHAAESAPAGSPSVELDGTQSSSANVLAMELRRRLNRVARALNFSRVLELNQEPSHLSVTFKRGTPCSPSAACDRTLQALDPRSPQVLAAGDRVIIELSNPHFHAVDVTILYVDAGYGIKQVYPHSSNDSPRFEPRGKDSFELRLTAEPSGFERLVVLTTPAIGPLPPMNFGSLAQESMPTFNPRRATGSLNDLLHDAVFGSDGFGTSRGEDTNAGTVVGTTTYGWRVMP